MIADGHIQIFSRHRLYVAAGTETFQDTAIILSVLEGEQRRSANNSGLINSDGFTFKADTQILKGVGP
ncbi:hypothetical protein PPS11_10843 [Pseudomonas putida S11]|nr:hypothetical protein PPS11_10843 [Pseudomonas putida S11]